MGMGAWLVVQRNPIKLFMYSAFITILIVAIVIVRPANFQREGKSDAGITDLTDREQFWYGAMILIQERPLLGYGYSVEGKVWLDPRFNDARFKLWSGNARTSLHNGYLSTLIGVGVPMFLLWCSIIAIPLWRCLQLPYSPYKGFAISVFTMLLFLNFVESIFASASPIGGILFWPVWLMTAKLAGFNSIRNRRTGPYGALYA
jgi:O-antigen ligase